MRLLELGGAVVEGIVSIPTDLYYGTRRTGEDLGVFGREVQKENQEELQRIGKLIRSAMEDRNVIQRTVMLILDDFFEHLPEPVRATILEKASDAGAKIAARTGTQLGLSRVIGEILAKRIAERIMVQRLVKIGTSLVLSAIVLQGLIERSSNASKRLKNANRRLYDTLRKHNVEPLYFTLEEVLAPVVSAGVYEKLDCRRYNQIMDKLQREIE